jgi:hypothetical protein
VTNIYKPDKPESNLTYLTRYILICFGLIGAIVILGLIKKNTDISSTYIMIGLVTILWTYGLIGTKIIQEFQLNIENKTLRTIYLSLNGTKKEYLFDLKTDRLTYLRTPSRVKSNKWTLRIISKTNTEVKIDAGEFGFTKETLDRMNADVSEITAANNIFAPGGVDV